MREPTWYWKLWWWFGYHGIYQINWWWKKRDCYAELDYPITPYTGIKEKEQEWEQEPPSG
jgi:hypothetical protein